MPILEYAETNKSACEEIANLKGLCIINNDWVTA